MTPPTLYLTQDPPTTTCTLLRATTVYEGILSVGPTVDRRMRMLRAVAQHSDVENVLTGDALDVTIDSNYTMYGSGPVTTIVYNQPPIFGGPAYRTVEKTRAATKVTGRYGWIDFNDPRVNIVDGSFEGDFFFKHGS